MTANLDESLFRDLVSKAKLNYISDLSYPPNAPLLASTLEHMNAEDYTVVEWQLVITYITGEIRRFDSPAQALRFLINQLQGEQGR